MGCCESIEFDSDSEYLIDDNEEEEEYHDERHQNIQNSLPITRPQINQPSVPVWNIADLLAETEKIDEPSARNIVHLFENKNTIPFICRYRRDLISRNITADKLRIIKNSYREIVGLRKKAESIINQLEQITEIDSATRAQILAAKTIKELEFLEAIYQPTNTVARSLDYDYGYHLLIGQSPPVPLSSIVDRRDIHFDTFEKVKSVICNVVSEIISKHNGVLNELRRLQNIHKIILKCKKVEGNTAEENPTESATSSNKNRNDPSKYEKYFNFENGVRYIKPHQILAINRAENSKFITVQIIMPYGFKAQIKNFIHDTFMSKGVQYELRNEVFENAFEQCYTNNFAPLVYKQTRQDLKELGEKKALDSFAKNLKELLLTPPLKGERILGIDPGFKNGCKFALISETTDVLEVGIVYPHKDGNDAEKWGFQLSNMLSKYSCKRIALGNGIGRRETEEWLTELFDKSILDREQIKYDIVSERGASAYSCSKIARNEFPKYDARLISISIARRLNDPLSEYVKIKPRHLGIGMYQHDMNDKCLSKTLDEVVSECVSYVGVDINTASLSLLKYVAGLSETQAKKIIQFRQKNGPFRTRSDLLRVKMIGEKTFRQCAGFIRIEPKSFDGKIDNVLDCTWVHPESYSVAINIINKCNLQLKDIGTREFILTIEKFIQSSSTEMLVDEFDIPAERLQIVLEALQRQLFQDYRPDWKEKLFKKDITKIEDLFIGEIVTGQVSSVADFGAFIDIGLEQDGLVHNSKMNRLKLKVGDRVSTTVIDMDVVRGRVELRLDEVL